MSDTPRRESGLSAPRTRIFLPLTRVISKLLTWEVLMTGLPKSRRRSHIIVLACPRVGAMYITAEPSGQFRASMRRVTAESLDLPHRRPAATTLKRCLSAKTACCHLRSSKLRLVIFGLYIAYVVYDFLSLNHR